jgi:hypothetical protein
MKTPLLQIKVKGAENNPLGMFIARYIYGKLYWGGFLASLGLLVSAIVFYSSSYYFYGSLLLIFSIISFFGGLLFFKISRKLSEEASKQDSYKQAN